MIFGLFTLFVALGISGIAAYYSIIGLTAIFSAAYWPIIIMGGALEVGKLTAASWLYQNWKITNKYLRSYLLLSVVVIMFITSMGIFGFLSKAHLENVAPTGSITQQTDLVDFKIGIEQDKLTDAKEELVLLRKTIRDVMSKGHGVKDGLRLRKGLTQDTTRLIDDITISQEKIIDLQGTRFGYEQEIRNLEVEIGPLKYVADLIFGEEESKKYLDKTVRWVIMIIIFVFDPLAVLLIIAANISIDQWRTGRRKKKLVDEEMVEFHLMVDNQPEKTPTIIVPKAKEGNVISTEDGKTWKQEDVFIIKKDENLD